MKTHGDRYDYSMVSYRDSQSKVAIECNEHGIFWQKPNNHIMGNGCPSCAISGFKPKNMAWVYFLMADGFVKVGVSNNIKQRMRQLRKSTPFEFIVFSSIKTNGKDALRIEKKYHDSYDSANLHGFNGATEWLKISQKLIDAICEEAQATTRTINI